jgi:hypothetical protein
LSTFDESISFLRELHGISHERAVTFLRCLVASGLWRTERVNDELCDFPEPIDSSKSTLQILWLLPENTHLETKRSNEGKTESERASEDSDLPLYLAG